MQSKEGATILELSHNKIEEHLPRPLSLPLSLFLPLLMIYNISADTTAVSLLHNFWTGPSRIQL